MLGCKADLYLSLLHFYLQLQPKTLTDFCPSSSLTGPDQMASNIKLQLAAAFCLILLVVSETPEASGAVGCDIFQIWTI